MSEKRFALHTLIGNLLFPPRCLFCGTLTGWEEPLCSACRAEISAPSLHMEKESFGCDMVIWCAQYAGGYRAGLERFKFKGIRSGRKIFGEMLLDALRQSSVLTLLDGITYVPMQRGRERSRGYNQARLLAEYIAEKSSLPLRENLLCRMGKGTAHGTGSRRERVALVRAGYLAGESTPIPGECLLLVDDIVTTGETMSACASLLRQNGAGRVYGAAPLRTPAPGQMTDVSSH